ncbi:UDP-glucuronosyltransferase 2A1-like [Elysia marginata]|uniref:UDP-glucuronosyltransferase 2A1-like n=1 Tax=Elysia marginata TaxID=1093978 RepID=A0AAV4JQ78_9GAST|nr:UDP-glucuronosyltransferase 2A1-like [Elysia marginata]
MQGSVNGGRRRGRQEKRWEDNFKEWTGLELRNTLQMAEDREEWKAVVRRSIDAPRRIPNLRDRTKRQPDNSRTRTPDLLVQKPRVYH